MSWPFNFITARISCLTSAITNITHSTFYGGLKTDLKLLVKCSKQKYASIEGNINKNEIFNESNYCTLFDIEFNI